MWYTLKCSAGKIYLFSFPFASNKMKHCHLSPFLQQPRIQERISEDTWVSFLRVCCPVRCRSPPFWYFMIENVCWYVVLRGVRECEDCWIPKRGAALSCFIVFLTLTSSITRKMKFQKAHTIFCPLKKTASSGLASVPKGRWRKKKKTTSEAPSRAPFERPSRQYGRLGLDRAACSHRRLGYLSYILSK